VLIRTFGSIEETSRAVAQRIAAAVRAKPGLVIGLPTGRTAIPVYAALRKLHAAGGCDFSRVTTFNLDEFVGVDPDAPGSFRYFMEEHLFQHVGVDRSRIHFLDGRAGDLAKECARYEAAIEAAGGLDLQWLGLGANGHIGFNEPGKTLPSVTHRVSLHEVTRRENAALFGGDVGRVPREALSMGMGTILKAATIVLTAFGKRKARCVEGAFRGPLTTRLPASFLQVHRDAEVYLDRDAASLLGGRV
jgi:glucosamine-6-phosphate deaminase